MSLYQFVTLPPLSHIWKCWEPLLSITAKSLQSCPTLCDPTDGGPPGSPVSGILQARTLEWVAISFSNAWKGKVKVKSLSRVQLFVTPWSAAYQAPPSMGFSRQEYWSGVPLPSPAINYYKSLHGNIKKKKKKKNRIIIPDLSKVASIGLPSNDCSSPGLPSPWQEPGIMCLNILAHEMLLQKVGTILGTLY